MLYSVIYNFNNFLIDGYRISTLTTFWVAPLFGYLIYLSLRRLTIVYLVMFLCSCIKVNNLLALSNTFFIIHPLLLYTSFMYFIGKQFQYTLVSAPISATLCAGLALVLGGMWSMQELNWGGWWNWDVLEINALLIYVILISSYHLMVQRSSCTKVLRIIISYSCIIVGFILNKSGLGTSVHSFVMLPAFQINYVVMVYIVVFWFILGYLGFLIVSYVVIIECMVYFSFSSGFFLKSLLLALMFIFNKRMLVSSHIMIVHTLINRILWGVILINIHNISIQFLSKVVLNSCEWDIIYRLSRIVIFDEIIHVWVFENKWLSKPISSWYDGLTFIQWRSKKIYIINYPG